MTKKEIVRKISDDLGKTQLETKEIVQRTLDAIIGTLVSEGQIELRNFGIFKVKRRAPRKARNPRTGERVSVPPKNVVTFKPGKEMEEKVREMDPANLPFLDDEDLDFEDAAASASVASSAPVSNSKAEPEPAAAKPKPKTKVKAAEELDLDSAPQSVTTAPASSSTPSTPAKAGKKNMAAAPVMSMPAAAATTAMPLVDGQAASEANKPKRARKSPVS